jgi:NADH-quinone oxidoreductase subunit L
MVSTVLGVLAAPLLGALVLLLAGRRLPASAAGPLASLAVAIAFICALLAAPGEYVFGTWLSVPGLAISFGLLLDPLSSTLITLITGVGLLIHVYSISYLHDEPHRPRYFAGLNLFVFFMLLLVLANNAILLFAGWEGVGLASYLLIGFWRERKSAGDAARKAFLVNRLADAALLSGFLLLFAQTGTLDFARLQPVAAPLAMVLICIGAAGKSAQFPLHVWLPEAMEGPTPVSALIHAATMVTAGIYLLARFAAFFPFNPTAAMLVPLFGAFTALFAAVVALSQDDIKRVLAWSTISQLGYMYFACGIGAWQAAAFHLFTHAFFKALLFLAAGSVIHALHGEQDLRRMGGLRSTLPRTFLLMSIGALALAGLPGLSGFASKEEILFAAGNFHPLLLGVALLTSLLTAFYMGRLLLLVFFASPRAEQPNVHEAPPGMLAPMAVLALGSLLAGFFPPPFLSRGPLHLWLAALSAGVALAGLALAWHFATPRESEASRLGHLIERQFRFDEFASRLVHFLLTGHGSRAAVQLDHYAFDSGPRLVSLLGRVISAVSMGADHGVVDGAVRFVGAAVRALSYPIRLTQSGYIYTYALIMLIGFMVIAGAVIARQP